MEGFVESLFSGDNIALTIPELEAQTLTTVEL